MKETFGEMVKGKRQAKEITLRKFASLVGISPAYISQIENNRFSPPSEEVICKIAHVLEEDKDELLALVNKIHSDLVTIINRFPQEVSKFLRTAQGFDQRKWRYLIEKIKDDLS